MTLFFWPPGDKVKKILQPGSKTSVFYFEPTSMKHRFVFHRCTGKFEIFLTFFSFL